MKKILAIDDEEAIRTTIASVLASDGRHTVMTAADDKERLKAAQKRPDPILLGIEVLKNLKPKKKTREIPVMMLTGVDTQEAIDRALSLRPSRF